jgi:hypothetical protein
MAFGGASALVAQVFGTHRSPPVAEVVVKALECHRQDVLHSFWGAGATMMCWR